MSLKPYLTKKFLARVVLASSGLLLLQRLLNTIFLTYRDDYHEIQPNELFGSIDATILTSIYFLFGLFSLFLNSILAAEPAMEHQRTDVGRALVMIVVCTILIATSFAVLFLIGWFPLRY